MWLNSILFAGNRLDHRVVIPRSVTGPDAAGDAIEFREGRHIVSAFPGDSFTRIHPLITGWNDYERMGFPVRMTGVRHQKGISVSSSSDA